MTIFTKIIDEIRWRLSAYRARRCGYITFSRPLDTEEFERVIRLWKEHHPEIVFTTDDGAADVIKEMVKRAK